MQSSPSAAQRAKALALNSRQTELLALIVESYNDGCAVYSRQYHATVDALRDRGLVSRTGYVRVASMGKLETRATYRATAEGEAIHRATVNAKREGE